jgi:pimeloyl-ACP methyl ester carboxylesterase
MTTGGFSQIDIIWEDPGIALFLHTLASFSRLILFDRRGTGASDPLPPDPCLRGSLTLRNSPWSWTRSAVSAPHSWRKSTLAPSRCSSPGPGRNGPARSSWPTPRPSSSPLTTTPSGSPAEVTQTLLGQLDQLWGSEALAGILMPSRAGDERFRRWFAKLQRTGASPRAAKALLHAALEVDARPILPLVHAPTLVLHRRDAHVVPIQHARFLAEHIPDAKLVELPGSDLSLMWETREQILDLIEEFLTGVHPMPPPKRVLATVLFTDIVGSTERARELGDRRWRQLLDLHDELADRLVDEATGRLIKTTGRPTPGGETAATTPPADSASRRPWG